ncbi:MAG: DUF4199 domain-containing protein [Steroidobacteraceae bacterium]
MEEQRGPSIVAVAIKYGLIQGVLWFVVFLVPILAGIKPSWVETAIDAAILLVLMILAHRGFKRTRKGKLTYSQGLGSGTLLSSTAALVTCILVYVYVRYINAGYLAVVIQAYRTGLQQRGMTGAQAAQAMAITSFLRTPVGIAVSVLVTWVVLGFIVALIVSIFTQKDPRAV